MSDPAWRAAVFCEACPSEEAMEILRELVALKEMSERNNGWVNMTGDMSERDDYNRRKPIAWAKAREAVS